MRIRVDGVIEPGSTLPGSVHAAVTGRLKVMAGLDIAERRAPQDGRFRHSTGQGSRRRHVDIRVATLPTRHGERITLRLLDPRAGLISLEELGMAEASRAAFERAIERPFGMLLLTGPTGAGKTTTLYAALRRLVDSRPLNVLTVEDPIEYELPGVAQVAITRGDKVSFHRALRHLLRHDPDVMMIGEIRDAESADIAIKSALTGHLVLSTLHANTALGAVTRLLDLGVERFLIGATLRLLVAQRLVRRLCVHHTTRRPLSQVEATALGDPALAGTLVADAAGCRYCRARGYVGRLGLYEAVELDGAWGDRIVAGADEPALFEYARELGLPTLRDEARAAVLRGATSPTEAVKAVAAW